MFGTCLLRRGAWVVAAALAVTGCQPRPAHEAAPVGEAGLSDTATAPAAPSSMGSEEAPLNEHAPELKIKKSAQVAIIGYHDFTTGRSTNPMVINIQKFRQQMQALKDARLDVISMNQYLAWRHGEHDIPDPSVMITIDDGWKSTHTLAMPVLKEFGYPFTIFLYRNFIGGGGRSLSPEEIRELISSGATVGSHSVSHPFPGEFKRRKKGPPEEYVAWLEREFVESRQFLEQLLGVKVNTFAYPGGYYTQEMAQKARGEWGYEALFTCNPVRTSWDTPIAEIGRFIIYGNDPSDRNFHAATGFHGAAEELGRQLLGGEIGDDGTPQPPLVVVKPGENETVTDRRPIIDVDLSRLQGIAPESVTMRLAGFGLVPAAYNPATRRLTYRPVEILRSPEVSVHVRLRRTGEEKDDMVSWKFFIDMTAHYLSPEETQAEAMPAAGEIPAAPAAAGSPAKADKGSTGRAPSAARH
jgi:peptidoglycan/xylan/chitin deacetylase (PgdA/CDA1 family)